MFCKSMLYPNNYTDIKRGNDSYTDSIEEYEITV